MNKKTKRTIMLLALILLILGVGYAFFNSNLNINGSTTILNNNFSVIFTNLKEKAGSVTATTPATITDENSTSVTFDVSLASPGDYYGFSIDIKNEGSLDAMVDSVTMTELTELQQKYLTYEILDNNEVDIRNKDLLAKGTTRTINVLISYKTSPEAYPTGTEEKLQLSFSVNFVEADKTAIDTSLRLGDKALFPNIQTDYSDISSLSTVLLTSGGWSYQDTDLFANKTITKINIPVISVKSLESDQCMTMGIVDKTTFAEGSAAKFNRSKKVCITKEQLSKYDSTTIKDYIMVDIEDEYIGANEFPTFGLPDDDISFAYVVSPPENLRTYLVVRDGVGSVAKSDNHGILMDIYVNAESEYNPFASKTLSLLGDSISSFDGYSNNPDYNSTLNNGAVWYTPGGTTMYDLTSVNDTWWMKTINDLGMTLNVNNSYSGSRVFAPTHAGYLRATEMDNNDNVSPDIIAVFMGVNDVLVEPDTIGTYEAIDFDSLKSGNSYITPTTFAEAYAITIDKMLTKYKGVDIYCFTLLPAAGKSEEGLLIANDIIKNIAAKYNVNVVDLYNDSGINSSNLYTYTGDGQHPNAAGMAKISETFVNKLKFEYGVK
ncbi:MAG: hypothetical protein E7171_00475 [Firmicutes bacterium]|nr:hypothetical protein [Bacillota bacterium]